MSGTRERIRKLGASSLFAMLTFLCVSLATQANDEGESPAAPQGSVSESTDSKKHRSSRINAPELADDPDNGQQIEATDLFPQLSAPIVGLDGQSLPGSTPGPIVRWLDINDQFLDESDPYPPGQDPFREWPEVQTGWFSGIEVLATAPRIHSELNSANLGPGDAISGTFVNTFQLPVADFQWTAMPRVFVGYRLENGLGEIILSYRFIQSTGSSTVLGFDAAGNGQLNSRITNQVIDLDYGFTDPAYGLPWYLPSLVRRTMGIRFASSVFDTSVSGQQILQQRTGDVFTGAGPRVNFEGTWTTTHPDLAFTGGVDSSAIIGFNYQRFGEQALVGGNVVSASARTDGTTTVIPVLRVQAGMNYTPDWGDGNLRLAAGFSWERWWYLTDTNSVADLTFAGPFVRAEFRW